jgi:hypothetical protein
MKNIKGKYWQDSNTKQVYCFPKSGKGDPRPVTVTDIIQSRKLVGSEILPKEVADAVMESKIGMPRNKEYLDGKSMTPYQPPLEIDRKGKQIVPWTERGV